jgi:hypothetical protein
MDRESIGGGGSSTATAMSGGAPRSRLSVCSGLLLLVTASGCHFEAQFTHQDFGSPLPANASVDEVVRRVNANIERVSAWRSNDVRISGQSLPVHLTGTIAVERPRNFHLTAGILRMDEEADFGSNAEWFWFWVKHGSMNGQPSYVYQARHEDVPNSQMLSQIPFQPDWLMEALGVVPIDTQHVSLHPEAGGQFVNLISERLSPSGQMVKKVIRVDLRRGLVLSHSLVDMNGLLIARATLDQHIRDRATGIVMPHVIALEWPQAQLKIKLEITEIEVNPTTIPPRNWQVPRKPYYPAFDIGAMNRKRAQFAGATAGPGRATPTLSESASSDVGDLSTPSSNPPSAPLAPNDPPSQFGAPSPLSPPGRATLGPGNGAGSRLEGDSAEWNQPIPTTPSGSSGAGHVQLGSFDASPRSSPNFQPHNSPPLNSQALNSLPSSSPSPASSPPPLRSADADDPFLEAPAAAGSPPPTRPTSAIPSADGSGSSKGDPFESLPH